MSEQCAVPINVPTKPRPRASLPRYSDEMAKDKWQQNPQIRDTSHSPSIVNNSNNDVDYSPPISRFSFSERQSSKYDESEVEDETKSRNQSSVSQSPVIKESNNSVNSIVTVLCLFAIVIAIVVVPNADKSTAEDYRETPSKDEILKHVEEEIRQLRKEFQNQEKKIWQEIYSGIIEVISNPERPSIFVLFADRNDPMSCLASTIGELGRMALGSKKSLILKPTQLDNDTGEVIETLRLAIPHRKSVIFWDLLSINDAALKAFHNLCDRENPLIKEAIYIITVKADGYSRSENPLEFIENQLRSNFSGRIDEDSIMPLITRITDGPIISVEPESNMHCRFKNIINY